MDEESKMTIRTTITALALLILGTGSPAVAAEETAAETCAPSGELNFLCGMKNPEDLASLPGGRWIVASGMAPKSGLHLVDGDNKTWERWIAPVTARAKAPFDKCPAQPPADELQIHGISVRDKGNGHATLYAVNHGGKEEITQMNVGRGREAIEVFDVDMTGAKPTLSWEGCVPMPGELVANSVASGPDGAIFATVMLHPDNVMEDLWKGIPTGAVYKWTPGAPGFQRVAGTELTANNGIEVSPDGKTLYVNGLDMVTMFTNTNPANRLNGVKIKNGFADNIHWVGGRLVVAGPRTDLCAPTAGGVPCQEGYYVADVDPKTLAITTLAEGPANSKFSGTSVGLPVGKTLWIGSYSANKLAYRQLP
jgi:hypothetical protein